MSDWTTEPYVDRQELYYKNKCLAAKRTLEFISKFPDGVTRADFKTAGIKMCGIDRLMMFKVIKGTQIPEPERGPRSYHWLWKTNGGEKTNDNDKGRERRTETGKEKRTC